MIIRHCLFKFNNAERDGGAVYVFEADNIVIEYCTFRNNSGGVSAGVTSPGVFYYRLIVDTLGDDGSWVVFKSNSERYVELNNNRSKDITDQNATLRMPRVENQTFRVRLYLRENDSGGNDFSSSLSVVHTYRKSNARLYAPETGDYST